MNTVVRFVLPAVTAITVVVALFAWGPYSLEAAYERDVAAIRQRPSTPPITDTDLDRLPPPVRRYLRNAGVVGKPRPSTVHARMHGRIRGGAGDRWMTFSADQHNRLDQKSRLFYLDATMYGLPVFGYHRYDGPNATMDIRVLGLVRVQQASGSELTRTETVTLFNDMCLLAPGALVDASIVWTPVNDRIAKASFSNAGHTIAAELSFNDAGDLVDFWSDDRLQTSADGQMKALRWSTPIAGYRQFGAYRLPAGGAAQWHPSTGAYSYIELTFDDITYDAAEVQ